MLTTAMKDPFCRSHAAGACSSGCHEGRVALVLVPSATVLLPEGDRRRCLQGAREVTWRTRRCEQSTPTRRYDDPSRPRVARTRFGAAVT